MEATTTETPSRLRADFGRGVDPAKEALRLAASSQVDVSVLDPARLVPAAEVEKRELAALFRIEAQNATMIALLTEIRDQGRAGRKA